MMKSGTDHGRSCYIIVRTRKFNLSQLFVKPLGEDDTSEGFVSYALDTPTSKLFLTCSFLSSSFTFSRRSPSHSPRLRVQPLCFPITMTRLRILSIGLRFSNNPDLLPLTARVWRFMPARSKLKYRPRETQLDIFLLRSTLPSYSPPG